MCHGVNGISIETQNPDLAGQKQAYLAKSFHDYQDEGFKCGRSKEDCKGFNQMKRVAASLSENRLTSLRGSNANVDIDNLSHYFSYLLGSGLDTSTLVPEGLPKTLVINNPSPQGLVKGLKNGSDTNPGVIYITLLNT
jgi:hypothetical protein